MKLISILVVLALVSSTHSLRAQFAPARLIASDTNAEPKRFISSISTNLYNGGDFIVSVLSTRVPTLLSLRIEITYDSPRIPSPFGLPRFPGFAVKPDGRWSRWQQAENKIQADSGWFVFLESPRKVWIYCGGDRVLLLRGSDNALYDAFEGTVQKIDERAALNPIPVRGGDAAQVLNGAPMEFRNRLPRPAKSS